MNYTNCRQSYQGYNEGEEPGVDKEELPSHLDDVDKSCSDGNNQQRGHHQLLYHIFEVESKRLKKLLILHLYSIELSFDLKALYKRVAIIIIPVSQQLSCPTGTHLLLGEQGEFSSRGPEPEIEPTTFRTAVQCFIYKTTMPPIIQHFNYNNFIDKIFIL